MNVFPLEFHCYTKIIAMLFTKVKHYFPVFFPYRIGSATVLVKNAINVPIKNAVTTVPIPTVAPKRNPTIVQNKSEDIRQN